MTHRSIDDFGLDKAANHAHLTAFEVPRAVEFCALPRTAAGEVQRFERRERVGSVTAIDV